MTIKELKNKIENLPDNMEVLVGERITEHTYGYVNSGEVKKVLFYDESDPSNEDVQAHDEVFVLEEE
ncbi:hypothetical protein CMU99_06725 [Elizabethkingia anophelis]|nr:hypothetical protein [Elizabethkingia anophelis]